MADPDTARSGSPIRGIGAPGVRPGLKVRIRRCAPECSTLVAAASETVSDSPYALQYGR